jgi:hypothetical protein
MAHLNTYLNAVSPVGILVYECIKAFGSADSIA